MNAARRAARAGRNLLIALLLGAAIIAVIVVSYMTGRVQAADPTTPSAPTSASAPEQVDDSPGEAPTGCLGGSSNDVDALLLAQQTAPHTTFGAVEVAAAFLRWGYRYPLPDANEIHAAAALFPENDRGAAEQRLRDSFQRNLNPARGAVPDGTRFRVSTVTGGWIADGGPGTGEVTVSVQAAMVIDGALSPTKTASEAFVLRWQDSAWRILRFAAADESKVSAGATTFTAGC